MRVALLSLAAYQRDRGQVQPGHMAWFTFTPENNVEFLRDEILLRTNSTFPGHRNWTTVPGKKIELGIEWIYAILTGGNALRVYGLSIIAGRVVNRQLDIQHRPMLVLARDQKDAVRQAGQLSRLEWPSSAGFVTWGGKAVEMSREWFATELEWLMGQGILATKEANREVAV